MDYSGFISGLVGHVIEDFFKQLGSFKSSSGDAVAIISRNACL